MASWRCPVGCFATVIKPLAIVFRLPVRHNAGRPIRPWEEKPIRASSNRPTKVVLPMFSNSRFVRVTVACHVCGCHFVRSLHKVGWVNVFDCPDCGTSLQLEAGDNARNIAVKQTAWMRAYQRHHFPSP
jgi:hypothetical protein